MSTKTRGQYVSKPGENAVIVDEAYIGHSRKGYVLLKITNHGIFAFRPDLAKDLADEMNLNRALLTNKKMNA